MAANRHTNFRLFLFFLLVVGAFAVLHKQRSKSKDMQLSDWDTIVASGQLRVATLYSSTSYFQYREREMGYEYELCKQFADAHQLSLKVVVAPNIHAMLDSLKTGVVDLIAYNVPANRDRKQWFQFCGREFLSHLVLVQSVKSGQKPLDDVTDLKGKHVYVIRGTRQHQRLMHLNEMLDGGICIEALSEDTLTGEELIDRVARGEYDYTVSDHVLAQVNKTFYRNLDVSLKLGFSQQSFWVARTGSPKLAAEVNRWFRENVRSTQYKQVSKRYFERSKGPSPFLTSGKTIRSDGSISAYDALFKKYGSAIGWDWRLLASLAWQESNFDTLAVSWVGAKGLMQLMPKTAEAYGVDPNRLSDPEISVQGATRLLSDMERNLASVADSEQRKKLVLAAFNSGYGHVLDARALARKHRRDPDRWDGDNVGQMILFKSKPEYYDDPVCKHGYLRGSETAAFVTEVWTRYEYYLLRNAR